MYPVLVRVRHLEEPQRRLHITVNLRTVKFFRQNSCQVIREQLYLVEGLLLLGRARLLLGHPRTLWRRVLLLGPGFKNNYFTETCSGSETGSYFRPTDFCFIQL